MYTDEFLMHYGRKGMKWGQHIYGKERMVSRKSKRNFDDHETIFRSLNDSQRRFLTGTADDDLSSAVSTLNTAISAKASYCRLRD